MQTSWELHDAKARFSQVVNDANSIGPQYVTRQGREVAVVVSVKEFQTMTSTKPSFKEFLLNCPKMGNDFEFVRQKDCPRDIEL